MRIVSKPPKTGEQFLVCYVDSDNKVVSNVLKWIEEWEAFDIIDECKTVIDEEDFFKGATILVSKGE